MDFTLSKEHEMLRDLYRKFTENEVKPLAEDIDEQERFPVETVKKLARYGFMGIPFPKEYGGAGGDMLAYVMAVEELSKACGTTGVIVSAHTSLCCAPIYENVRKRKSANTCQNCFLGNIWARLPLRNLARARTRTASRPGQSFRGTTIFSMALKYL